MPSFSKNQILLEDNHLVVINKLPGQLSQGDKTGDISLIDEVKNYLVKKYNKPGDAFLGSVHRLDRPTSGILIFAKTSKALTRLNEMIKKKTIQKTYWTLVNKQLENKEGEMHDFLAKNSKLNKSFVTKPSHKNAKEAILKYKRLLSLDRYHLYEVELITGRHHQIRTQFASRDCFIKGDLKYGFDRPNKDKSIHLHARKVEFIHPVKKEKMVIVASPPQDVLWDVCVKNLGK